jgi:hypothetical protein
MSGDVNLYTPGSKVTVEVVADADGNYAERGDVVEIVGQSQDLTQVALNATRGAGVGHLGRDPMNEADRPGQRGSLEGEEFAEGDLVGQSKLLLRHYVDWFRTDAALEAGDEVVSAAGGGVDAYDDSDTGTDGPGDSMGVVWTLAGYAEGTSGKVAVVRHK